jgi:hypothetical protein
VATYTITADATWGYIRSRNATYATARAGGNLIDFGSGNKLCGQSYLAAAYNCYEAFVKFDTSSVVGTITSAQLEIHVTSKTGSSFVLEARVHDWGASLVPADWVAGADLSSKTLVADVTTSGLTDSAYNTLDDVDLAANINQSGTTYLLFCSKNQVDSTAPIGNEYITLTAASRPKLVIETLSTAEGDLDSTIAAFTVSSTSTLEIKGDTNADIGEVTVVSETLLIGTGEGAVGSTIEDVTILIEVDTTTNGYFDNTISNFTTTATATMPRTADLSVQISNFTLSTGGSGSISGTVTATIAAFGLAATTEASANIVMSQSIGSFHLAAQQSGAPWPSQFDFPSAPLDGTWVWRRGEDTLRTDNEAGARLYRARNGGNRADVTFSLMLPNKGALDALDLFYKTHCSNGSRVFYWDAPDFGYSGWLWAQPPAITHVAKNIYRVDCALMKEAA